MRKTVLSHVAVFLLFAAGAVRAGFLPDWSNVGPPRDSASQRVIALAVLGDQSEILFASFGPHNLQQSTDAGRTWSPVTGSGAVLDRVHAVPGQPTLAYGSVGREVFGQALVETLYFSSNAGASWENVPMSGVPSGYTGLSQWRPVGPQPGVVYAAYSLLGIPPGPSFGDPVVQPLAVARSSDGGRTWSGIDAGLTGESRRISVAPSDVAVVYVTTTAGVFRSRESGRSWQPIWIAAVRGTVGSVTIDAESSATVYVTTSDGKVWVTADGGDNWRQGADADAGSFGAGQLLADPADSGRVFAVDLWGAVFESRDRAASWSRLAIAEQSSVITGIASVGTPTIAARGTQRFVLAIPNDNLSYPSNNTVISLDVSAPRLALGTDLWWNPADSGWGVSIVQHDSGQMFIVWFTYDAQGKPTWRFMPGGDWSAPDTFTGTLYTTQGPPRNFAQAPFSPALITTTPVGSATFKFANANSGEVSFDLSDGTQVRAPISRMAFGPVAPLQYPIRDLWWNPKESGWGISLHQQYSTLFATWFLYDDQGMPTWLIMPDAKFVDRGTLTGSLYRPECVAGAPYTGKNVTTTSVGTATFTPNVSGVYTMMFTIDGKVGFKAIEHLPF